MLNINAAPDWDNLKILSRNREDSRTYFIPGQTANIKAAARSEIDQNKIILLNGMWEFRYFRSVADVPDDFVTGTLGGKEEHVPSVWQAQGYEKWHYSNVNYPIPLDPPHVPNHNPCGVYKRKFVLPKSFYDKEIFISFLGVASAYHVYINGIHVTYVALATGMTGTVAAVRAGVRINGINHFNCVLCTGRLRRTVYRGNCAVSHSHRAVDPHALIAHLKILRVRLNNIASFNGVVTRLK